jgi:serine/threonine protein kinase
MADTQIDYDLKTMQQAAACGYEAIQRKGRGTYGFVYEVGDAQGDLFAFKYILPDDSYKTLGLDSLNEIDILSRVDHPYIIHAAKIITSHNCNIDGLAVILPLADRTLFDIIRDPLMTTENKLPILYKLAKALEFLHSFGILHLDIKSTNVVLQGIQENHPYFIDFGLSMVVDNVATGKYDRNLRVTIDHRAPEILSGGRIYNGAVDVWAFGIMMLYILSGRGIFNVEFATITENEFYNIIIKTFSTPDIFNVLLTGIRPKYQALCIDFFTKVLQIDPLKRLTAQEICEHPIFNEFREPVVGTLITPHIPYDYSPDHRDILKLLIHWATSLYETSRAELLFLAIDLFNRLASFYKDRDPIDRMTLAASSLWVASKLTNSKLIPLDIYVPQLTKMVPDISAENILNTEIEMLYLSSGILNVSSLYRACSTGDELKLCFGNIILDKDSTLYARVDIPGWTQIMKHMITTPVYNNKDITISELMA